MASGGPTGTGQTVVGVPYSLEDEGHGLLPVLPLEWQGPRQHLELRGDTERDSECSGRGLNSGEPRRATRSRGSAVGSPGRCAGPPLRAELLLSGEGTSNNRRGTAAGEGAECRVPCREEAGRAVGTGRPSLRPSSQGSAGTPSFSGGCWGGGWARRKRGTAGSGQTSVAREYGLLTRSVKTRWHR